MHRIVLILPRQWSYWIGSRIADLNYLLRRKMRKAVESNIQHVLVTTSTQYEITKSIIRFHTKAVFRNFTKYLVDFFSFSRLNAENIHKFVKIKGLEHMQEAFRKGKGVIGLTAHLGNWELSGVVMALLGFSINVVVLNHENTKINRLFVNQRAMKGVNVIPVGVNARQYLNVLKKKQLIALVSDRITSEAGIETQFFKKPTVIPRGPAVLSLRTGAPIVPGFMIRTPEDTFNLVFEKPIEPEEFKDNIGASEELITQRIVAVLEKYIGRYPSQWFLFYKVW